MSQLEQLVDTLSEQARPLREPRELSPVIDRIKNCRVVMLGEATHGTHEFYEWRRMISEWLIVKHGFRFVAVEGDWPPCQAFNRYLKSSESRSEQSARKVLTAFRRWPTWMWANTEMVRFGEWMRSHNERSTRDRKVGFHGLDVYSLFESIDAVIAEVKETDPFLARRIAQRYSCFDPFRHDERAYARSLVRYPEGCERHVAEVLRDLFDEKVSARLRDEDSLFDVRHNARVVRNAEDYYRTLIRANEDSWNVRDRHMLETLEVLFEHYGPGSKGIVWAHNTHVGDYRATDMLEAGLVNLGGLVRERFGKEQVGLVGFSTHRGSVVASHSWAGPIQVMQIPRARHGSYEHVFHECATRIGSPDFSVVFDSSASAETQETLSRIFGHRAIGVVYDPEHERFGNYVPTAMAQRYDALVYCDKTRALEPLVISVDRNEIPETWPIGQ